eukprot:2422212-Rhodomonas_salina.2
MLRARSNASSYCIPCLNRGQPLNRQFVSSPSPASRTAAKRNVAGDGRARPGGTGCSLLAQTRLAFRCAAPGSYRSGSVTL